MSQERAKTIPFDGLVETLLTHLHLAYATNATTLEKRFNHSMRHTTVLNLDFIS
jgi:hypothetical protein